MLRLVAVLAVCGASALSAQQSAPAYSDTAEVNPDIVTAYAIKSGRLVLSSKANPTPTRMPDAAYTNQDGLVIVFLDGSVTRVQRSTGEITEIDAMRLNRQQRITLLPSTNALMAVSDMALPSGTFRSEDGRSVVTFILGRPTEFSLSDKN
ncbi:MAG: hypothetical protein ABIS03_14440 [Gemmatimonadaceae bacterium]